MSKHGRLVVHHHDFGKSHGDKRWPKDLTWEEIRKLRAKKDGSHPLEFRDYAAAAKGRARLLVDVKEPSHSARFYQEMERILRESGLLESAFFIGTKEACAHLKGKARVSLDDRAALARATEAGGGFAAVFRV